MTLSLLQPPAPTSVSPGVCHACGQPAGCFVSFVGPQGQVVSRSFCQAHAQQGGLFHPLSWDLLSATPVVTPTCSCGMSASVLQTKGRAGCGRCYSVFAGLFVSVIRQVQPAASHTGRQPRRRATASVSGPSPIPAAPAMLSSLR